MRARETLTILLACASAACVGEPLPAATDEADGFAAASSRALDHVRRFAAHAPAWEGAELGAATPVHRADLDGVAYWEFAVVVGDEPAGHVLIATGSHDVPIVEWSTSDRTMTELLGAQARAETGAEPARFLRLDRYYAAEGEDGDILATTLPAGRSPEAWHELGRWFAGDDSPRVARAAQAAEGWRRLESLEARPVEGRHVAAIEGPKYCWNPEAPMYHQLPKGSPGNTFHEVSGCGATAWAMLIGWIDQRAAADDPKWAPFRGIYRQGGAQNTSAGDAPAPHWMDWGARVMTDNIRKALGSIGWPGTGTSTDVWQMGYIGNYLAPLGIADHVTWPTYHIGGGFSDGLKPGAIAHLCERQQPAILGIPVPGSLHYVLATEYYRNDWGDESFFLNYGWGGKKVYEWPAVFFVGTLLPKESTPPAPPVGNGMEILEATYYGFAHPPVPWHNASAQVSAACNNKYSCDYTVSPWALGDPHPGVAKNFSVRYRCGWSGETKYAQLAAPADGKTVNLSCPIPPLTRRW